MSEEEFVYAWLLAAKSGVGTTPWQPSTIELQVREAKQRVPDRTRGMK